ncbi:MAG: YdcF family protein, partial [Gammaproteobacteria bacterium]
EALERDFRVPVRWVESVSQNTRENARLTAGVLDVRRIVLVTHALHMPRAMREFHAAGFDVTPAPLGFFSRSNSP